MNNLFSEEKTLTKKYEFEIKNDEVICKNKKTGYWQRMRLIV